MFGSYSELGISYGNGILYPCLLKAVVPVVTGTAVPKEKMDSALEDLKQTMDLFQSKFLKDSRFIAGEEVSLADLVAIVEIMQVIDLSFRICIVFYDICIMY